MENTAQRPSWRPNFSDLVPWLTNLPKWQLRLLVALVGLPFLVPAYFLNSGINLIPMIFVLAILVWQSPNIREKFHKLPQEQQPTGMILMAISLSLLAFTAPGHVWGLPFMVNYGLMPFFGSLQMLAVPHKQPAFLRNLQAKQAKKVSAKPRLIKAKTKPLTNSYRKRLAKQAKRK